MILLKGAGFCRSMVPQFDVGLVSLVWEEDGREHKFVYVFSGEVRHLPLVLRCTCCDEPSSDSANLYRFFSGFIRHASQQPHDPLTGVRLLANMPLDMVMWREDGLDTREDH